MSIGDIFHRLQELLRLAWAYPIPWETVGLWIGVAAAALIGIFAVAMVLFWLEVRGNVPMRRSVSSWLSVALLIALSTTALAEPVTLRGIPMGTSLADFRRVPFPDESKHPKTRIMCSGDKGLANFAYYEKPPRSEVMERIGVVACSFYTPAQYGNPYRNGVDLANIGGWDTTFYFSPSSFPEGTRERLYLITVTPKTETYQTLVDALTTKYGRPETASEKIKNRMGAEFVDERATWHAGGSTILVRKYNGSIYQALVAYSQDEIMRAVGDAGAALAVENAKKL